MVGVLKVAVSLVPSRVAGEETVVVVDAQSVGIALQGQALRSEDACCTSRPVDPSLRDHRDRQRELAFQTPFVSRRCSYRRTRLTIA